jgi:outer membrane protein
MGAWIHISAAACLAVAIVAPATASPVSRMDAIDLVLETSPRLAEADAQVQAARAGVLRTRSDFLPTVTFNASGGVSDRRAQTEDGTIFSEQSSPTTANIEINQTLYASGQRSIGSGLSRLALERARLNLQRVERDIILETRLAYEAAYFAVILLEIETSAREAIAAQLEGAFARERAGAATQTDIAQAEARLAEAEARIATARAQREVALAELEALTGIIILQVEQTSAARLPLPSNLQDAIDDTVSADPDLKALELAERETRLQMVLADRRYGPTVSLNASAQRVDDPSPLLDRDDEARAVVSLSVPIFNGGARSADRRAGLASHNQARFRRLDYQRRLVAQVRALWASLQSANSALSAQIRREAAARDALAGVEEGLEAGLSSTLDVLDAVRELQASQRARLSAQRAVIEAELNLAAITGYSLDG